ncbi:GTP-binding protein [Anaerovorax odorimutans]|uniref:GTP-binding protein n=1 Tax=Anaerovorax odorimutans TaxID=109327 RepID=A0ABT1RRJ1_9FIRM|nr:GTP-binding protein [Anaerovorax odorimutans]MCQ4637819.1 GTP-binding protein [Anaerovorax odorimutans]
MTKVDIISGFLGAGKTTFIKELISKVWKDEKIVLIENEFGEIGIDSRFMQNSGIEVTEMNSGCICCTLVGDFARSLKQVVEQFNPDRVIIEPSGVGKLSDVAGAVEEIQEEAHVQINSRITVVDGKKARMHIKNFGEFFNNQIESATTIVVSRTQMMTEEKLKECVALLREHNQDATIITTAWEQLSGKMILDAIHHGHNLEEELREAHSHHAHEHHHDHGEHDEHHHHHGEHDHHHDESCGCGHDHHDHSDHSHGHDHHHDHDHEGHHHADEVFTSWGIETVHKFNHAELADTLKMLSMTDEFGTVLRAKGIVEGEDGQWMEFDMVPEETEIRQCQPDYTGRICVIGTELKTEDLERVFGK